DRSCQRHRHGRTHRWVADRDVAAHHEHHQRKADVREQLKGWLGRIDHAETGLADDQTRDEFADDHRYPQAWHRSQHRAGETDSGQQRQRVKAESLHVAIVHGAGSNVAHPSGQASITTRPDFARETHTSISSSPSRARPRRSTSPSSTLTLHVPQKPCWQEYAVVESRSSMTSSADRFAGTLSTRCERASSSSKGTPSTTGGGPKRS